MTTLPNTLVLHRTGQTQWEWFVYFTTRALGAAITFLQPRAFFDPCFRN